MKRKEKYVWWGIIIISPIISYFTGIILYLSITNLAMHSLTIFGILIGFLLTISTLLTTLNNALINIIKESGSYPSLLKDLKVHIQYIFCYSLFCLIIISVKIEVIQPYLEKYIFYLLILKSIYLGIFLFILFKTYSFIESLFVILSYKRP